MTIEKLRELYHARPFQPLVIHLADGRAIPVASSEFLSFSPSGRTIIVHYGEDSFSIVDLLLVTELEVRSLARPKKAK